MTNWAADFLAANPDLAARPFTRNRGGFTFDIGGGQKQSVCVGVPAHYDLGGGVMAAVDTAMTDDGTFWGGAGTPAKIRKSNGTVESGTKTQRPSRIVRYRPSNGAISNISNIPNVGSPVGDTWTRVWGDITYSITITETSVRELLTMATLQSLPGGTQPTDYVMIEEAISATTMADGWIDTEYMDGGYWHPLPTARDSLNPTRFPNGHPLPVRRRLVTVAGQRYMLTGLLVSDYQTAVFPLTIDPDYAADSGDFYVEGTSIGTTPSYATARSTSTSFDTTGNLIVGQLYQSLGGKPEEFNYQVLRSGVKFDTSSIPDGDTISAVTMGLTAVTDGSSTDFDVKIAKYDWSGSDPIAAGNRETIYDGILAATVDASWRNTSGMTLNSREASASLATAWVSKTGYTYYAILSLEDVNNSAPTNFEYVHLASQNNATSGYRPILSVTHSGGGGSVVKDLISFGIIAPVR
jgi:hypothetical protein